jgi:hypothetical protein
LQNINQQQQQQQQQRKYPTLELKATREAHIYKTQLKMQETANDNTNSNNINMNMMNGKRQKYFSNSNSEMGLANMGNQGEQRNDEALLNCILEMKPPRSQNSNDMRQSRTSYNINNNYNENSRRTTSSFNINQQNNNSYNANTAHKIKQVKFVTFKEN